MGEPFIGEIKMAGFDYAPRDWALCDGAELQCTQNQALFSLIGNAYGGDGSQTFRLPDFRGRVPVHQDYSQGYFQGDCGGVEEGSLSKFQMPEHTHTFNALSTTAQYSGGGKHGDRLLAEGNTPFYTPPTNLTVMNSNTSTPTPTQSMTHDNVQPSAVINFMIALDGIYPSRN